MHKLCLKYSFIIDILPEKDYNADLTAFYKALATSAPGE
jgi:hypothetical protein